MFYKSDFAAPIKGSHQITYKEVVLNTKAKHATKEKVGEQRSLIYPPCPIKAGPTISVNAQCFVPFDMDNIIALRRKIFNDDWFNILRSIQMNVTTYCSLAPFQPNKAIMICKDHEQVKILESYKD